LGLIEKPPDRWGSDRLSEFIELTWNNVLATFHKLPKTYKTICRVDEHFYVAADNLKNPSDPLVALFLLRAHSAFRAAVRLAMSGQLPEAYMVLRGALEQALYGFFINQKPDLADVWLKRHENDQSTKKVKDAFQIVHMLGLLLKRDAALGSTVRRLYERTIDFGAHPNERAIITNMQRNETDESIVFNSNYTSGDGVWLRGCLKTCVEVGVACLKIFEIVFRERFRLLGISDFLSSFRPAA
jgi:hypothetical protein